MRCGTRSSSVYFNRLIVFLHRMSQVDVDDLTLVLTVCRFEISNKAYNRVDYLLHAWTKLI